MSLEFRAAPGWSSSDTFGHGQYIVGYLDQRENGEESGSGSKPWGITDNEEPTKKEKAQQ